MKPGTKPTPTKLKILKGTDRKDRQNNNEAQPELGIPSPPSHLSKDALVEWGRVTDQLYTLGLLSGIDSSALAAYCQAFARWKKAEELLNESELVIPTAQGNLIQNPLVGIANKAMEMMHKFLTEFGMTPSSRSRVSAIPVEKKKSKWAS